MHSEQEKLGRKSGQKMSCFKKDYVMTGVGIF